MKPGRKGRTSIGVVIHRDLLDRIMTRGDRLRLEGLGRVRWARSRRALTTREAIRLLRGCRVGIGGWGTPWPGPEMVRACPALKLWVHAAGTVKRMFGPHIRRSGIVIASCKPANGANVAEMTLAEIILGLRRAFENAEANRRGPSGRPERLKVMYGSTVGIVGASEIGRQVMALLGPFRCRIMVYDPFITVREAARLGAEKVASLRAMCRRCDAVSLHAPSLPSTRHMMGAPELKAMRDDAVLINTARGALVDEAALVRELRGGRLYAMLDVTDPEPPPRGSPLRKLPNVLYTSHLGGPPSFLLGRQAVDNVERYLLGRRLIYAEKEGNLQRVA